MAQKAAIKSRIKSINATKKITGAMKLIASVKLQKQRNSMLKNREYAYVLKNTLDSILSNNIDVESAYLKTNNNPLKGVIVFCSDLGLCGGYNANIIKLVNKEVNKDDYLYVIGTSSYNILKRNFKVENEAISSDNINFVELKKITRSLIELYINNKIGLINVIYTHFVNNVSFDPRIEKLLPQEETNEKGNFKEVLLEPNPSDILNNLIPMVIENEVYSKWLESKTAEQGSRRFAMENATDNAEELTEELLLAYNQARQAAITQEITEIISGADAL